MSDMSKQTDVWVQRLEDGSTVYYPASYAKGGVMLPFVSAQGAQSANNLPSDAAQQLQEQMAKDWAQSGQTATSFGESGNVAKPSMAAKLAMGQMSQEDLRQGGGWNGM